jgi:Regulator of polyketide synthase expression
MYEIYLNTLLEKLSKYCPKTNSNSTETTPIISVKQLFKDTLVFYPDVLYIGSIADLPTSQVQGLKNIIVIIDNLLSEQINKYHYDNLILITGNINPAILISEVDDILIKHQRIVFYTAKLLDISVNNMGIQNLLNYCYNIFNNPVYFVDAAFNLIAVSKYDEVKDVMLKDLIQNGSFSQEQINTINYKHSHQKILNSNNPIVYESGDGAFYGHSFGYSRIISNISLGENSFGHIGVIMENGKKIDDFDLEMMSKIRDIITQELKKFNFTRNARGLSYEFFFTDILDGKATDSWWSQDRMKLFGIKNRAENYIVTLDTSRNDDIVSLSLIRRQVESILYNSMPVIYNEKLVILISGDAHDTTLANEISSLIDYCKKNGIYGALSNCFSNFSEFLTHYKQNLKTIDIAFRMNLEPTLFLYRDFTQWHILDPFFQKCDVMSNIHPEVKLLYEYDYKNNTECLKTLFMFLIHERNINLTATMMHLHRNTLQYRLRKITELVKIDFDDYKERQWIIASILIQEYKSNLRTTDFKKESRNPFKSRCIETCVNILTVLGIPFNNGYFDVPINQLPDTYIEYYYIGNTMFNNQTTSVKSYEPRLQIKLFYKDKSVYLSIPEQIESAFATNDFIQISSGRIPYLNDVQHYGWFCDFKFMGEVNI